MSTNGLVTLTYHGEVKVKIIAGCNGFNAPALAQALRDPQIRKKHHSAFDIYNLARSLDFGCAACLVAQCDSAMPYGNLVYQGETPLREGSLYYDLDKFRDPRFNPRWENGTAEFVEIVEASASTEYPEPAEILQPPAARQVTITHHMETTHLQAGRAKIILLRDNFGGYSEVVFPHTLGLVGYLTTGPAGLDDLIAVLQKARELLQP